MKLFEPITIRGMKVRNRIVYPAIQMNMGLTNRRARAFALRQEEGNQCSVRKVIPAPRLSRHVPDDE